MRLQKNPFYILKLSCDMGRREIISAAEEMSFILDSRDCFNAQNDLINLNKRLGAELSWFPEFDKINIQTIQEDIENGNKIPTDGLVSLSKLNATLFNFSISREVDPYELGYVILDIDDQYSHLNIKQITDLINKNRISAKLTSVQETEVFNEINKKRDDIRQTISERLNCLDQDSYIELITTLAEKCIADHEYNDGVVLSDVVDQYEVRMQSQIEKNTEAIESHIEHIQQLANDEAIGDNINSLIRHIKEWDRLVQPLQLKSQASGMPHEISERLGYKLRNLALYIHNEKGKTNEALFLVDAMKVVFAELGNLADIFDSDSDILNNLLQNEKNAKEVIEGMNELQKQSEFLKSYATSADINSFVECVNKLDAKLKTMDLDSETRTNARKKLCYLGRETAIELHNTKHQTEYALTITKSLVDEFGDMTSLLTTLTEDVQTLNKQLLISNIQTPNINRHHGETKHTNTKLSSPLFLIGIAIAVVLGIIIITSSSGSLHSSTGSQSSTLQKSNQSSYSHTDAMNQSELGALNVKINNMEAELETIQSEIEDFESDLKELSNNIEYFKAQYDSTGSEFYYNSYYNDVEEYNGLYSQYSDKIEEYNSLYEKYSDTIDEYNKKAGY